MSFNIEKPRKVVFGQKQITRRLVKTPAQRNYLQQVGLRSILASTDSLHNMATTPREHGGSAQMSRAALNTVSSFHQTHQAQIVKEQVREGQFNAFNHCMLTYRDHATTQLPNLRAARGLRSRGSTNVSKLKRG